MKKLRIAQVAPLWYNIPPEKYGGTELVVYNLTEELVKMGHDVTLFATGKSKTSAKLFSVCPDSLIENGIKWHNHEYNLLNLQKAVEMQNEFDVIHSHILKWDLFFAPFLKTPLVSTIHSLLGIGKKEELKTNTTLKMYQNFPKHKAITISNSQRRLAVVDLDFLGTVYNGIQLDTLKFTKRGGDCLIWISRFAKKKGAREAIKIAKRSGMKIILAGRIEDEPEKIYFNTHIKPEINNKDVFFYGELNKKELSDFYGSGKALLYPISWHEPFGLVMAEAMACGTPVIAYKIGSIPEVVKDGVTGFVVKDENSAVEAVKNLDKINRADCRKWVEEKFSSEVMAKGYEKIYYDLVKKQGKKLTYVSVKVVS